ncbi:hypothetical protein HDE_11192 [Halotydeus destructor]|nr:hypothetical protein HDE_11192 [Halotydeus destructor]
MKRKNTKGGKVKNAKKPKVETAISDEGETAILKKVDTGLVASLHFDDLIQLFDVLPIVDLLKLRNLSSLFTDMVDLTLKMKRHLVLDRPNWYSQTFIASARSLILRCPNIRKLSITVNNQVCDSALILVLGDMEFAKALSVMCPKLEELELSKMPYEAVSVYSLMFDGKCPLKKLSLTMAEECKVIWASCCQVEELELHIDYHAATSFNWLSDVSKFDAMKKVKITLGQVHNMKEFTQWIMKLKSSHRRIALTIRVETSYLYGDEAANLDIEKLCMLNRYLRYHEDTILDLQLHNRDLTEDLVSKLGKYISSLNIVQYVDKHQHSLIDERWVKLTYLSISAEREVFKQLTEHFPPNLKKLKFFDKSKNGQIDFKNFLTQHGDKFVHLDLTFGGRSIVFFAKMIAKIRNLKYLRLAVRSNNLTDNTCNSLYLALMPLKMSQISLNDGQRILYY